MSNKVIIIGAFHEVVELAEDNGYEIIGFIDNDKTGKYMGYSILGKDEYANNLDKKNPVIISPDKPELRAKLANNYQELNFKFITLISKDTKISRSANIGSGTIIQYGVNVSSECVVGRFVKLNTMCNVMHNVVIGNFTTIAPNAVILGYVKIGECCYIGSNATVLPNIEICDEVIIGAGAVVTKNITNQGIYIGNPAKKLLK